MSDVPKYREHSVERARRLGIGKPHIYWARDCNQWHSTLISETCHDHEDDHKAVLFTIEQDKRWTPVQKD